ncbi:MAG: diguanylate cyclase [Deltaproteobacteria bacterium RIFOXYA12_FULL_58_15]|nr:MAG: diguanylate cyclase [Deltaproteobacteria bacterium RIFOXYA12_FULL_58_15]OGR12853.1 MAG: diguanylate cyclase [Deltaproteobacteria bacterium RIFOXYB12_FULL_58_9]
MRFLVGRRLLQLVPTFLGVTLLTFFLLRLAPGAPSLVGDDGIVTPAVQASLEAWRELKGLNQPLWAQYINWLSRFVRFDFGSSLIDERPVRTLIVEALPRTLVLTVLALIFTYTLSIPLGIHSAIHRGQRSDRIISGVLFILYSMPSFWVALLLVVVLGGGAWFDLFPIVGLRSSNMEGAGFFVRSIDLIWHLVLPVFCLTYPSLARTSRFQRSAMLDVIRQDYIRTARAKGLTERTVILRHALKNSLLPILTLLSTDLPWILGGSVIVERIFAIRGMGMLTFEAILRRDYPVIMGVTSLVAILTMVGVLLGDLAYAWIDPRIRFERTQG